MSTAARERGGDILLLGNNERRMLGAMRTDPSRNWTLADLLAETGWTDQVYVAGAGKALREGGLVDMKEKRSHLVSLGL